MTRSRFTGYLLTLAAAVATGTTSASEANPGAHQHGQAELQLAVEGNRIDLLFTSPAYNLLGFEHEARTDAQKAAVRETTRWLGATPLVDTTAPSCEVMEAHVHHQAGAEGHDHHDHEAGHAEPAHPESTHTDVEVAQTLSCADLGNATALSTPLTERFPEIEHLSVEWVWSGRQGSDRLERGEDQFSLSAP
ncbi:DUF2796 domain-containing protein [Marinobacter sp.]|uniref:ZrgA family zinc uptake protein n=1 Tax=Marinobacter sp. TaxID=50741 RepID=UPI0035C6624C